MRDRITINCPKKQQETPKEKRTKPKEKLLESLAKGCENFVGVWIVPLLWGNDPVPANREEHALDVRLFRENPEIIREGLRARGLDSAIVDELIRLDALRTTKIRELEELRQERKVLQKRWEQENMGR